MDDQPYHLALAQKIKLMLAKLALQRGHNQDFTVRHRFFLLT